jgi:hypothetical protein
MSESKLEINEGKKNSQTNRSLSSSGTFFRAKYPQKSHQASVKEVINYNYNAEKLTLRRNIRQALTNEGGNDLISEASYALKQFLGLSELENYRNVLDSIYKQLRQPEEMLCESPNRSSSRKSNFLSKKSEANDPFREIDKLINDIDEFNNSLIDISFNNGLIGINSELLFKISNLLRSAKQYYLKFKIEINQSGIERQQELSSLGRIRGFLGYYYLKEGVTDIFTLATKENEYGGHRVIEFRDTFYKLDAKEALVEQAFHSLNNKISGQGSPPTEVLVFEKEQNAILINASKAVKGENLLKVLEEHPEWLNKMDSFNYALHVLLTLLACPSDCKAENYIVTPERDGDGNVAKIKLVSIDNDMAFDLPYIAILPQKKGKLPQEIKHCVYLKSIIFCMEQIHDKVDPSFRQALEKQSPMGIILDWLKELLLLEDRHLKCLNELLKEKEVYESRVPLKFLPGTIQGIGEKLCRIQSLIKRNPNLSYADLLEDFYPSLASVYNYVRSQETSVLGRITSLYFGFPAIQEISGLKITEEMKQELKNYTLPEYGFPEARTETLTASAINIINNLDYSSIDQHRQSYILEKIISDFSDLENFVFKNSEQLTDVNLSSLAQRGCKVRSLTLIDCYQIEGSGLSAILSYHPNARICLQGFESISSLNLLSLLQNCKDLILKIDGQEYELKNSTSSGKLFKQALQKEKYTSLITALLLSGAHMGFEHGSQSPLHIAILEGKVPVIRNLIRFGASLNLVNAEGKSPLDMAIEEYDKQFLSAQQKLYQSIICLLVAEGATETRYAAGISRILQLTDLQFSLKTAKQVFTFVYWHNLLTTYWVNKLLRRELTVLDLSPPQKMGMAAVNLTAELLDSIHEKLPYLTTLTIQGCTGLTKQLLQEIIYWGLDTILIDFQQASQCELATLNNLGAFASIAGDRGTLIQISHLTLKGQKFTKEQIDGLSTFIGNNPQLKKLELIGCHLRPEDIKIIAGSIVKSHTLECLNLNRNPLGDIGVTILIQALIQNQHSPLKELSLDETQAGIESAKALGSLLRNHSFLESLSLYKNQLGDEGVQELANGLVLRRLEDTKRFEDGFSRKGNVLKQLILNEVNIGDEGAKSLYETLRFIKSLVYLDVGYNSFGIEGSRAFIKLLQLNSSLITFKGDGKNSSSFQKEFTKQIDKNRQWCQNSKLETIASESKQFLQQAKPLHQPDDFESELETLKRENANLRRQLAEQNKTINKNEAIEKSQGLGITKIPSNITQQKKMILLKNPVVIKTTLLQIKSTVEEDSSAGVNFKK